MIEREFYSSTRENNEEYTVSVKRVDDHYECKVFGKFKGQEISREFTADGPEAEQQLQEWLFNLDNEVQAMMDNASLN